MVVMTARSIQPARSGNSRAVRGGKSPGRKMFHQVVFLRIHFKGKKLVFQFSQRRVFSLHGRADLGGRRHFLAHLFLARMFSPSRRLHRGSAVSGFGDLRGCGRGRGFALLSVRRRGRSADLRVRGSRG